MVGVLVGVADGVLVGVLVNVRISVLVGVNVTVGAFNVNSVKAVASSLACKVTLFTSERVGSTSLGVQEGRSRDRIRRDQVIFFSMDLLYYRKHHVKKQDTLLIYIFRIQAMNPNLEWQSMVADEEFPCRRTIRE